MQCAIKSHRLYDSVSASWETGAKVHLQDDLKHTAKIIKEWLWGNSVNVLELPSQSLDWNPIEHLWRDLKMAVHRCSPSNLMELERSWMEEWEKLAKNRCAKFVASYSKRLEAVIAAKGIEQRL